MAEEITVRADLHIEWVEDEAVVMDEQGNIHYLNQAAAVMFAHVLEFGYAQGRARLQKEYADRPDFEAELDTAVEDMLRRGLLEKK
jgi:hypothetical protein